MLRVTHCTYENTASVRALKTTKPCLARAIPDNYDHPFAKMHCKTQITDGSCSAWRWCTVRFIDQMGCYVRSFGLEKGVWLDPGWQLCWGSLSGPGRGAPDSYIPPIWRHYHPPAALHWPSALLLTPPCLHNRTNQNGHLLITSHICVCGCFLLSVWLLHDICVKSLFWDISCHLCSQCATKWPNTAPSALSSAWTWRTSLVCWRRALASRTAPCCRWENACLHLVLQDPTVVFLTLLGRNFCPLGGGNEDPPVILLYSWPRR